MLVQSLTKDRMLEIEASSVVDGHIDGSGHLILERHDGSTIDAGSALLAVPDATTTNTGVLELATQAEVNTGTDAIRAVTPATLAPLAARVDLLELVGVDIIPALSQAAAITSYPKGVSLMEVGSGSGWTPNGGFGLVVTYYNSSTRSSQTFYSHTSDKEWRRYYYLDSFGSGPGWGAWKFQGHEESLSSTSYVQSTPVSSYPEGRSHLWLTNTQAVAGGWSWGSEFGTVTTIRPWGTTDAQQYWQRAGSGSSPFMWMRMGNSGGWGSWKAIATEEFVNTALIPYNTRLNTLEARKELLGTASCTVTSGTSLIQHVTFSTAFASAPKVFCNMDGAPGPTADWTVRGINSATTGFDIFLRSTNGVAATFTINVSWQAIKP